LGSSPYIVLLLREGLRAGGRAVKLLSVLIISRSLDIRHSTSSIGMEWIWIVSFDVVAIYAPESSMMLLELELIRKFALLTESRRMVSMGFSGKMIFHSLKL
jgi:hypothetical protein